MQGCVIGTNAQQNEFIGGQFAGGMINMVIGDNFMWNRGRYINGGTFGNNVQYNEFLGNQAGLNIPNNFKYNKINGIIAAGTYFAIGTSNNVFNDDFGGGTAAVPLLLTHCVFNNPVTGFQFASTAVNLDRVIVNTSITNKTFPASIANQTVSHFSPDGVLWTSTMNNNGTINEIPIV
jgi:hypothetical protein